MKLSQAVDAINDSIGKAFPGSKMDGIATIRKSGQKRFPEINERIVGIDDTHAMTAYHRELTLAVSQQPNGYGNNERIVHTYGMALFLFFDSKRMAKKEDVIFIIQSAMPQRIDHKTKIVINNAILSDEQVFSQEYTGSDFRLGFQQHFIQFNYQIQMVLDKNCLPKCVGDVCQP